MKKTNKGFSMVELIIVIAIMAILAGALAPALIKYINKSRISTDIQTANTIATAIQTALSNEAAYDDADNYEKTAWESFTTIWSGSGDFSTNVKNTVGGTNAPTLKSKKCMKSGDTIGTSDSNFYYYFNRTKNQVAIADATKNHMLYPTASDCLTNENANACVGGVTVPQ